MLQSKQKIIISPEIILKAFMTELVENDSFRQIPKAISHNIIPRVQKFVDVRMTYKDPDKIQDILRPAARQLSQSISDEAQYSFCLLSSILICRSGTAPGGDTIDTVIYDDIAIRLLTYDVFDIETNIEFKSCRFDIGYSWCKIA